MKRTKTCPKCAGRDILRVEGNVGPHGAGNNIKIGMTILSCVKVPRYVCCNCGYTEEWIDREDIPKLKAKYNRTY